MTPLPAASLDWKEQPLSMRHRGALGVMWSFLGTRTVQIINKRKSLVASALTPSVAPVVLTSWCVTPPSVFAAACDCAHTQNSCDPHSGACICPPHTQGVTCEECEDGYWGYDLELGCQVCTVISVCSQLSIPLLKQVLFLFFYLFAWFSPVEQAVLKPNMDRRNQNEKSSTLKCIVLNVLQESSCGIDG